MAELIVKIVADTKHAVCSGLGRGMNGVSLTSCMFGCVFRFMGVVVKPEGYEWCFFDFLHVWLCVQVYGCGGEAPHHYMCMQLKTTYKCIVIHADLVSS